MNEKFTTELKKLIDELKNARSEVIPSNCYLCKSIRTPNGIEVNVQRLKWHWNHLVVKFPEHRLETVVSVDDDTNSIMDRINESVEFLKYEDDELKRLGFKKYEPGSYRIKFKILKRPLKILIQRNYDKVHIYVFHDSYIKSSEEFNSSRILETLKDYLLGSNFDRMLEMQNAFHYFPMELRDFMIGGAE